jgi:hypothetical protein
VRRDTAAPVIRETAVSQCRRYAFVVSPRIWPARAALLAMAIVVAAGCGSGGGSFDPASPCTTDGRYPGAYPDLEAVLPRTVAGRTADRLDSGRNCTAAALATLERHGVTELRFAGGLWERGSRSGTTLVVFDALVPLEAAWLAEFYEAGARAARNTEAIDTGDVEVHGEPGRRLDTLNDDSYQSVLVWNRGAQVVAVLVASDVREAGGREMHEAALAAGIAAFGAAG